MSAIAILRCSAAILRRVVSGDFDFQRFSYEAIVFCGLCSLQNALGELLHVCKWQRSSELVFIELPVWVAS